MSLAQRSIRSSTYTITASGVQAVVLFVRSLVLARLLDPEIFGIYTYAYSFVVLTKAIPNFGLGAALMHRSPESEGELAYRVHFTLTALFTGIWAVVIGLSAFLITDPQRRWVLWVILITQVIDNLVLTGQTILSKKVLFRRVALNTIIVACVSTVVALFLAWQGFGIWSLVSVDIVMALVPVLIYYVIFPVWRPKFGWDQKVVRYFLGFGKYTFQANFLIDVLDNIDDLWTGFYLGKTSLGYYSRAFTFATYPRRVIAIPLNTVATSTYAELKGRRQQLSQAFFRVNAFLIRTGFFFAGLLFLIAPEFIVLIIGEKWLPMLATFRLMLVYTLLDPIKITISNVFIAAGQPQKVVRVRWIQLAVLLLGLFSLGFRWQIEGVALAVDLMIFVGIALLFFWAREHVDFSLKALFGAPLLALVAGIGLTLGLVLVLPPDLSLWWVAALKILCFSLGFLVVLFALEHRVLLNLTRQTLDGLFKNRK